jgi:hypothetical protein
MFLESLTTTSILKDSIVDANERYGSHACDLILKISCATDYFLCSNYTELKIKTGDGFIVLTQEHFERYYKAAPALSDVRILTFNFSWRKKRAKHLVQATDTEVRS